MAWSCVLDNPHPCDLFPIFISKCLPVIQTSRETWHVYLWQGKERERKPPDVFCAWVCNNVSPKILKIQIHTHISYLIYFASLYLHFIYIYFMNTERMCNFRIPFHYGRWPSLQKGKNVRSFRWIEFPKEYRVIRLLLWRLPLRDGLSTLHSPILLA